MLKYNNSNFSLHILEYCESKLLREREQYYIDLLKPEYNILKFAGYRLGHILSKDTKLKISLSLKSKPKYNKPKIVTNETKLKLSLRSKGITIKIFDISGNLIKKFLTLKATANYFKVTSKSISKALSKNLPYHGFILNYEIQNHNKLWVYNSKNNKLIKIFDNIKIVSKELNIPSTTLYRYLKLGKIYKNKYIFSRKRKTL